MFNLNLNSSYCLSDFLCGAFGIEQTSNHLPERPDGDSCTVITPRIANSNSRPSSARSQARKEDEANMDYRGYRNNNNYQSGKIFTIISGSEVQ